MGTITKHLKVKLPLSRYEKETIYKTLKNYYKACNYVSKYVCSHHELRQGVLVKIFTKKLKEKFHLNTTLIKSVCKTVVERYFYQRKKVLWRRQYFGYSSYKMEWGRDYLVTDGQVFINTIRGKLYFTPNYEKYFEIWGDIDFGKAQISIEGNQYYLLFPVSIEETSNSTLKKIFLKTILWFHWFSLKNHFLRK